VKTYLHISPEADIDLAEQYAWLAEQAGLETAEAFFRSFRESCQTLQTMPAMGKLRYTENPRLFGLRQWRIKSFEKYLIFYLSMEEMLMIVRILHSSRDIDGILEDDSE
jgi:toxin ParE1/3/4